MKKKDNGLLLLLFILFSFSCSKKENVIDKISVEKWNEETIKIMLLEFGVDKYDYNKNSNLPHGSINIRRNKPYSTIEEHVRDYLISRNILLEKIKEQSMFFNELYVIENHNVYKGISRFYFFEIKEKKVSYFWRTDYKSEVYKIDEQDYRDHLEHTVQFSNYNHFFQLGDNRILDNVGVATLIKIKKNGEVEYDIRRIEMIFW